MPNHQLLKAHNFFQEPVKIPVKLKVLHQILEHNIRSGSRGSRPELIREWRLISLNHHDLSNKDKHRNLFYQYYLLLDVISDELVDDVWRYYCLEEIYECLEDLSQVCPCHNNQQHVMSLYKELHITREYMKV